MSDYGKPHFSELVWEGDERNMAIPSPEQLREEDAKRQAESVRERSGSEEGNDLPAKPEQLSLWEAELPQSRGRGGRSSLDAEGGAAVPEKPPADREQPRTSGLKESGKRKSGTAGDRALRGSNGFEGRPGIERDLSVRNGETGAPGSVQVSRPATTESLFVERARELVSHAEPEAEFVNFKSYWPTYGHMTGPQTKWYFYWRNEVRHGRYPQTDLSYIFLHVYELINGVGWETPVQGYEQLSALWEAYRGTFKRLDHYLGGWIADFSFVHKLDIPLRDIVMRAKGLGGDLAELELVRCLTAEPGQLTLPALALMSDYDVTKSKFYTGPGKEALDRYFPPVVALVDGYARRKHGRSLLEMYPPEPPAMRERYLFRSAVYDISLYGYSVLVPVTRISKSPPLRSLITRLLRLTENKLRALMDYRGRLKGISMDPELDSLVEKFLEREFRKAEREAKTAEIVIDKQRLERLQSDSDVVRQLLTVEDGVSDAGAADAEMPVEIHRPESGAEAAGGKRGEQPAPAAVNRNEDRLSGHGGESASGFPHAGALHPGSLYAEQAKNAAPDPSETHLPEISVSQTGRTQEESPVPATAAAAKDTGEDGDGLQALAAMLSPLQRDALFALAGPGGYASLEAAAAAQGALPDLLVDEINDLAMDVLGDLLIDSGELQPEYESLLDYLKR